MKKALGGDANTARWRSQEFCPAADPFPGARDGQNLISWRWSLVTTFTYKPSLVKIDAHNFELSW